MTRIAAIAVLLALAASSAAASPSGLPGARAIKVCAAAGPFWPTMTLALQGTSAWIACKEQSRVIRVSTKTGKRTKSVRLRGAGRRGRADRTAPLARAVAVGRRRDS